MLLIGSFIVGKLYTESKIGKEYIRILSSFDNVTNIRVAKNDINIVYVFDPDCVYCTNKEIVTHINKLVRDVKSMGMKKYGDYNYKFILVSNGNPHSAISYLRDFTLLDEISFGNGWSNYYLSNMILNEGGEKSTPQLLIIERDNNTVQHGTQIFFEGFNNERVLKHLKSMAEIINFEGEHLVKLIE